MDRRLVLGMIAVATLLASAVALSAGHWLARCAASRCLRYLVYPKRMRTAAIEHPPLPSTGAPVLLSESRPYAEQGSVEFGRAEQQRSVRDTGSRAMGVGVA